MNPETKKLQEQIDILTKRLDSLSSNTTIPLEVGEAFRKRLGSADISNKTGASETRTVNESGAGSYTVANAPDGFITIEVLGALKNIPYYN